MKYVFLSCVLVVAACAEPTAPTVNSRPTAPTSLNLTKTSESTPFENFVTNPCNGEFVLVTGTAKTDLYTSAKPNGSTSVRMDERDRGTGVGYPSETIYTYDSKTSNDFSSADPYPLHITTYNEIKLNAKGIDHSNDFTALIKTVTHINQQGTVTQDKTVESSRCGTETVTP